MKEFIKRITVILILMMMFLNNSFLLIISTAIDEIEQIIDEKNINVLQNIILEKYVNYNTESTKGVLAQFNLKTGIEYVNGEQYAPLGATGILLNVPKIDEEFPEKVEVVGKSTKATNGSEIAKDFRYIYNKDTGELKLAVVNREDNDGNIYNENIDGARDEYTIVCYYSENCYNDSNVERNLKLSGFVQANIQNEVLIRRRVDVSENWQVKENVSGLISTSVKTTEIFNGYIESNNKNQTEYETEYIENLEIDVSIEQLCDEVHIVTDNNFLNKNNELKDKDELIYKSTKIDKNKVMDLLGNNGYLQILNLNGDILGELNKDTEVGENGVYEIIYQDELNDILIKVSELKKIGTIVLQNTKHIKSSMINLENTKIYSNNTIKCFNNIEIVAEEVQEVVQNEEQLETVEIYTKEIYSLYNENIIDIREAESRIDLSIDKSEWTNNIQNDVVFSVNLVANDSRYKLLDNPVIEIKLPEEVEKVTLGRVALLYENALSIENTKFIEESKIIRITLSGRQEQYSLDSVVNGCELLIPVSLILKKEIPSKNTNIVYAYMNNGKVSDNKELNINIKSAFDYLIQDVEEQEVEENMQSDSEANNSLETEIIAKVGNEIIQENDVIYENESIVFSVKLINNTNNIINNPKVIYNIPDGLVLVNRNQHLSKVPIPGEEGFVINPLYTELTEQSEFIVEVDFLEPGDIYEKSFRVLVKKLVENEDEKTIVNKFSTFIDENQICNQQINYIIKKAELSINLYPFEKEYMSNERNYFAYYLDIQNLTDEDLVDVKVKVILGKELELESEVGKYDEFEYDENTGILIFTFKKLLANSSETMKICTYANKFEDNKNEYDVKFYSYIYCDENKKFRSDLEEVKVETPYISIIQASEKEGLDLHANDEIEYNFLVKNPSNIDTIVDISDELPEGLIPLIAVYECYEIKEDNSGIEKVIKTKDISAKHTIDGVVRSDFELRTYIPAKETLKIKIKAKVDTIFNDMEIVNFATVIGDEIFAKTSNAIKNKIVSSKNTNEEEIPDDPEIPSNPEQPDNPDKPSNPEDTSEEYSIRGVVWIDKNKDGKRIESEDLLQGIKVKLFDVDSNTIVVDENNVPKILETDENGFYNFNYIKKGRYIVLFEFDTGLYNLTAYQKDLISKDINSDVILKEVDIEGNVYKVGSTNIIELYENYYNIDMGLVENTKFDLKLDKYVSRITVNYDNKETVYEYDNLKLAKVEIPKKEISKTLVNIEYKIIITNEGNISGYVESIIDYLPKEMTFKSVDNVGWKKDSNNNLINDSLVNQRLNPGESKEITLLLSIKNVTKTLVNEAEIGIANNVNQIEDIDSTGKNKNQNEDDYSKAEVIVSIKTGIVKNIFNIFIVIGILIIISYVLYCLRNKKIRIFNIMLIIIIGMFLTPIMSVITLAYDESYGPSFELVTYSNLKYHMSGGRWAVVHSSGKFWCASPGYHLCSKPHKYLRQNVTWEYYEEDKYKIYLQLGGCQDYSLWDFSVTGNPPQNFTLTKNSSPNTSDAYYYNSSEIVLGPFNFSTSLNGSYISSWSVKDQNGSDITRNSRICNSNGSSKGLNFSDTFYISVPERVTSIKLTINANYKYKMTKNGIGITTYKMDTTDLNYCTVTTAQHLRTVEPRQKKIDGETSASISWNVEIPKGKIKIIKKDSDIGEGLTGAKFRITGIGNKHSKEVTMSSATVTLGVLPGSYKIEEIDTPNGYKLQYQEQSGLVQNANNITVGSTRELTFKNRLYGNLIVEKVDKDKNANNKANLSELDGIKFTGTKFKIYCDMPNMSKKMYLADYTPGEPSKIAVTASESLAKVFTVDWDEQSNTARFVLKNIPAKYKYYIEEIEITNEMSQYYDRELSLMTVGNLKGNWQNRQIVDTLFRFQNKQKRVDIEGYVWEDIALNKNTSRDNLYFADTADVLIDGLTVRLKKDGVVIAERKTKNGGKYFFSAKGRRNENGTGSSYTIDIDSLNRYLIEFEYNGLRYENVVVNLNKENGSKAAENYQDRKAFSDNFYHIKQGETGGGTKLNYTFGEYKSELVKYTQYTAESLSGRLNPVSNSKMLANTTNANLNLGTKWGAGVRTIKSINFGIYERPQPDLAISLDIENVKLNINGYEDTYFYNQRINNINNNSKSDDSNYDNNSSFSVKFRKNSGYRDATYTRTIYDSYIAYTKSDDSGENRLKVYVTYKIVVKNESSKYAQVVLENYIDKRYVVSNSIVSTAVVGSSSNNVTWNKTQESGEATIYNTNLSNMYIGPGESVTMSLTLEVTKEGILYLLSNDETEPIINVTEIKEYKTYSKVNGRYEPYGGIDVDSQPDNVIYREPDTYEDDTDAAPDFKLVKGSSKIVKGTVFEDNPVTVTDKNKLNINQERLGNGKYDNGESGVQDVCVILRNLDGTIAQGYKTDQSGGIIKEDIIVFTGLDGKYNLDGIVPGTYYIEYIYGEYDDYNGRGHSSKITRDGKEIKVSTQSYKSTIMTSSKMKDVLNKNIEQLKQNYDGLNYAQRKNALWYWYQDTNLTIHSSAIDNYSKREYINDKLKSIDYELETEYLSGEMEDKSVYVMNAKASCMDIAIEDLRQQVTQVSGEEIINDAYEVNFGVIERPRQSVLIDKEINYVRIALANGQTLIEGNPLVDQIDYVTYPNDGGTLTIEVDNEIIEGATLDVGYKMIITNNSERDYNTEEYYKYGTNKTNLVKLKIGSIVDYADEKLSLISMENVVEEYNRLNSIEAGKWYLITQPLTEAKLVGVPISPDVYNKIKKRKNMLVRYYNDVELEPTQTTEEVELSANKLLTDLHNTDQIFNNYVEILNVQNPVGRFYGEMKYGIWVLDTPGNFDVYDEINTSEADNNYYGRPGRRSARMQIIPPTGVETIIIYSAVGVICLTILAGGIIFIKKKVLD